MAGGSTQENGAAEAAQIPFVPLPDNDEIEAYSDDAYAESEFSETTTVNSAIYMGYMEHGRRYNSTREGTGQYYVPSDDKQFEHMQAQHLALYILGSQQQNPLFRAPIPEGVKNIIDLGTGHGDWAVGVADQYPDANVYGTDLYPPPLTWVPPNCNLEVDDVTASWTWNKKFDFVHLRLMLGAFTSSEWDDLYAQIYENTVPGGWIEHLDAHSQIFCSDDTMKPDSVLANFHKTLGGAAEASGRVMYVTDRMRERIEKVGFVNVHESNFKSPIGAWAKHPVYRDSGRYVVASFKAGLEGWLMFLLTRFGQPKPWTSEEVKVYVDKAMKELDQNPHIYQNYKRVWAQKPFDKPKA